MAEQMKLLVRLEAARGPAYASLAEAVLSAAFGMRDCGPCLAYWAARRRVISAAILSTAPTSSDPMPLARRDAVTRFVDGVHARHLQGLPLTYPTRADVSPSDVGPKPRAPRRGLPRPTVPAAAARAAQKYGKEGTTE